MNTTEYQSTRTEARRIFIESQAKAFCLYVKASDIVNQIYHEESLDAKRIYEKVRIEAYSANLEANKRLEEISNNAFFRPNQTLVEASEDLRRLYDEEMVKPKIFYDEAIDKSRRIYEAAIDEPERIYNEAMVEARSIYDEALRVYDESMSTIKATNSTNFNP